MTTGARQAPEVPRCRSRWMDRRPIPAAARPGAVTNAPQLLPGSKVWIEDGTNGTSSEWAWVTRVDSPTTVTVSFYDGITESEPIQTNALVLAESDASNIMKRLSTIAPRLGRSVREPSLGENASHATVGHCETYEPPGLCGTGASWGRWPLWGVAPLVPIGYAGLDADGIDNEVAQACARLCTACYGCQAISVSVRANACWWFQRCPRIEPTRARLAATFRTFRLRSSGVAPPTAAPTWAPERAAPAPVLGLASGVLAALRTNESAFVVRGDTAAELASRVAAHTRQGDDELLKWRLGAVRDRVLPVVILSSAHSVQYAVAQWCSFNGTSALVPVVLCWDEAAYAAMRARGIPAIRDDAGLDSAEAARASLARPRSVFEGTASTMQLLKFYVMGKMARQWPLRSPWLLVDADVLWLQPRLAADQLLGVCASGAVDLATMRDDAKTGDSMANAGFVLFCGTRGATKLAERLASAVGLTTRHALASAVAAVKILRRADLTSRLRLGSGGAWLNDQVLLNEQLATSDATGVRWELLEEPGFIACSGSRPRNALPLVAANASVFHAACTDSHDPAEKLRLFRHVVGLLPTIVCPWRRRRRASTRPDIRSLPHRAIPP